MGSHIQLVFENIQGDIPDILIAALSEAGFEGFEEDGHTLKAFVASDKFDEETVKEIAGRAGAVFSKSIIEETNWNQLWESGFQPVVVNDFVAIRAHFHEPVKAVKREILITPKMSFGTGHHATTWMMIAAMEKLEFKNKTVLDFGTGTGILAILSEKLGASAVIAIDNDEWSIANCRENILQNNSSRITVIKADAANVKQKFDIILANINKNVLLDNLPVFAQQIISPGVLVMNGLQTEDEEDIRAAAILQGFQILEECKRHNWLCLRLSHG